MASAKKQTKPQSKNTKVYLIGVLCIAIVALAIGGLKFFRQHENIRTMPYQVPPQATSTVDTRPKATITQLDATNKQINFPTYGISFTVPITYKTPAEIGSSFDQPTANSFMIGTPDLEVDKGLGGYKTGTPVYIKIENSWTGFTDAKSIENSYAPSYTKIPVSIENTAIPTDNPLVSEQNTRVFSYPAVGDQGGWVYLAQVKLEDTSVKTNAQGISLQCFDYVDPDGKTPSLRCRDIVKDLLSSLKVQ